MTDIFDTKITCKKCNLEMKKTVLNKGGIKLRSIKCENCGDRIIHPSDLNCLNHYKELKGKTYNVKLRVIGNSHAISIPKEIVNFMNEINKVVKSELDNMVKLCFEDFRKLSLNFGSMEDNIDRRLKNEERW